MVLEPANARMGRQLREAIDHLRNDLDRVAFWADAMDRLAQPIPEYDPGKSKLNQFGLAQRSDASRRAGNPASRVPGSRDSSEQD